MPAQELDRCLVAVVGKPFDCYETVREICKNIRGLDNTHLHVLKDATIIDVGGEDARTLMEWYMTNKYTRNVRMLTDIHDEDHVNVFGDTDYEHFIVFGNPMNEIDVRGNGMTLCFSDYVTAIAVFRSD